MGEMVDDQDVNQLSDLDVLTVGLVGKAANRRRYLLLKSFGGEQMGNDNDTVGQEFGQELEKASTLDELKRVLKDTLAGLFAQPAEEATEEEPEVEAGLGKDDAGQAAAVAALKALQGVADDPMFKDVIATLAHIASAEEAVMESDVAKSEPDPRIEALEKAQAQAKLELQKAQAQAEEAERIAKEERDKREKQEFLERARSFQVLPAKAEELADLLLWACKADETRADHLERLLKAADKAMLDSGMFNEHGSSAISKDDDPFMAKVRAQAKELRAADANLGEAEAFAKAYRQAGLDDREAAENYVSKRQSETGRR